MQEFTPGNTDKARSVCIFLVCIPKFWIYRNVRNCCEMKRVRERAAQGQGGLRSQVLRAELVIRPNTRLQWRLSFYQRERYRFETLKVFTSESDERSDKREYCLYNSGQGASGLSEPSDRAVSDCPWARFTPHGVLLTFVSYVRKSLRVSANNVHVTEAEKPQTCAWFSLEQRPVWTGFWVSVTVTEVLAT